MEYNSQLPQNPPLGHRLEQMYENWSKMRPIGFVLVTAVVIHLANFALGLVLDLFGINEKAFGGTKLNHPVVTILYALVLAPIIKTFLQFLPIYITQKFIKWKTNIVAVIISTVLFSLAHLPYSFRYFLEDIPAGLFLALTYIIFQHRARSGFWMTSYVHSLSNLISLIIYFLVIK